MQARAKENRFGVEHRVLGASERDSVDASSKCHGPKIFGSASRRRDCIGQSSTVQMNSQAGFVGGGAEICNLGDGVGRAQLRRLRQREHPRLDVVNVSEGVQQRREIVGPQLSVVARDILQLHAENLLWCTCLVDVDVGGRCAHDRLAGLQQRTEGNHVGACSAEGEQHLDIEITERANRVDCLAGVAVETVGRLVSFIGSVDRVEIAGVNATEVVARKIAKRRGKIHRGDARAE